MSQHLIVVHLDGDGATLRDRNGRSYDIPPDWLPTGAQEGTAVIAEVSAGEARSELAVRLVEGITEPEGTDIGA